MRNVGIHYFSSKVTTILHQCHSKKIIIVEVLTVQIMSISSLVKMTCHMQISHVPKTISFCLCTHLQRKLKAIGTDQIYFLPELSHGDMICILTFNSKSTNS